MIYFSKVTQLPDILTPDTIYFVRNHGHADLYLSNSAGTHAYPVSNTEAFQQMLDPQINALNARDDELAARQSFQVVANLAARNLLEPTSYDRLVLVLDATGDNTVASGSQATYIYEQDQGSYVKVTDNSPPPREPEVLDGGFF